MLNLPPIPEFKPSRARLRWRLHRLDVKLHPKGGYVELQWEQSTMSKYLETVEFLNNCARKKDYDKARRKAEKLADELYEIAAERDRIQQQLDKM